MTSEFVGIALRENIQNIEFHRLAARHNASLQRHTKTTDLDHVGMCGCSKGEISPEVTREGALTYNPGATILGCFGAIRIRSKQLSLLVSPRRTQRRIQMSVFVSNTHARFGVLDTSGETTRQSEDIERVPMDSGARKSITPHGIPVFFSTSSERWN